jgi:hypothetical protein
MNELRIDSVARCISSSLGGLLMIASISSLSASTASPIVEDLVDRPTMKTPGRVNDEPIRPNTL